MLRKTKGIVLRSVKYGETSIVSTVFTEMFGVQSYMIKGVRSTKTKNNRAGLLQPSGLLEMVVYQKAGSNIQQVKELQAAYIYCSLQEEIVKNSISLFSVEFLLRLLPQHASIPELFKFSMDYFCSLDKLPVTEVANFPVYFIIESSRLLGYEIRGSYGNATPYLNADEGSFTNIIPSKTSSLTNEDLKSLSALLEIKDMEELKKIEINASCRYRILDWYIEFLRAHAQHLGNIKSLTVLQAVLH